MIKDAPCRVLRHGVLLFAVLYISVSFSAKKNKDQSCDEGERFCGEHGKPNSVKRKEDRKNKNAEHLENECSEKRDESGDQSVVQCGEEG